MKLLPELIVLRVCGATPRSIQQRLKSRFPGNISVLEFFSIESSLKAISSNYGSNKERNVHLEMRNLKQTEEQRKERLRIRREKERKTKRISAWLFSKDCSGVMKMSWREN